MITLPIIIFKLLDLMPDRLIIFPNTSNIILDLFGILSQILFLSYQDFFFIFLDK